LQFDGFLVQIDGTDFEINADGGNVTFRVRVVSETKQ
jgi:hypothetical protein